VAPGNVDLLRGLGLTLTEQGRLEDALAPLRRALAPTYLNLLVRRVQTDLQEGDAGS
jgi:Flp pilus assembly protein TadD